MWSERKVCVIHIFATNIRLYLSGEVGRKCEQTKVYVTPFFKRTFSDPITSYACEIKISTVKTYKGLFGTKAVLDKALYYRAVDL